MKLGYIHISKEEQSKVFRVLKLCSESSALDELGIGRIRDAFSNMMFPGSSSLQKHAIYFSLLPQIYKTACKKKYIRVSEVKSEIIRLEKMVTRKLCASCPKASGITGSDTVNKRTNDYVKYDPAYIYNSGLLTFEILQSGSIYQLIYSASKHLHNKAERVDNTNIKDRESDVKELESNFQFCKFPVSLDYDIEKDNINLTMSTADIDFVKGHMLKAHACEKTLFKYLLEHDKLAIPESIFEFDTSHLPSELATICENAKTFAKFIHIAHLWYNYLLSKKTDIAILEEFNQNMEWYHQANPNIKEVLCDIHITDNSGIQFCLDVADCLDQNIDGLDDLIRKREALVKRERRKINSNYLYNPKAPLHHHKLNYRWSTVRTLVQELRGMEVSNG